MDKNGVKKVGLVLSGGGAKGAYEIGVIQALEELGLADSVTGVSGTSVGALNSVLFVNRDIKKSIQIWEGIEQKDFTYTSIPKQIRKMIAINIIHILLKINNNSIIGQPVEVYKYFYYLIVYLSGGIYSQERLEKLINDFDLVRNENYRKYDMFSTIFNAKKGKVEYCEWHDKNPDIIKKIILASANIPFIYPPKKMILGKNKNTYYDGGLGDNTPIKPLYDKGYRDFYVVYLINQGKLKRLINRKNKEFPGAKIFNIYPDNNFKYGIFATLTINKENIKDLIQQGYDDAIKILEYKIECYE